MHSFTYISNIKNNTKSKERINVYMYPISIAQKKYLNNELIYKDTSMNNIVGVLKLGSKYNYDEINQALNEIVCKNDSHRLHITVENGEHFQYIKEYEEKLYPFLDFNQNPSQFGAWLNEQANVNIFSYDNYLYRFYILKLPEGEYGLFSVQHHMIADAWSMTLLINYFIMQLIQGNKAESPNYSFVNEIENDLKYLESKKFQRDELFWKNKLDQRNLFSIIDKLPSNSISNHRIKYKLSKLESEKINKYCMENNVSISDIFLCIMNIIIHKKAVNYVRTLGLSIHNRQNKIDKYTTGNYVRVLPLICNTINSLTLSDLLKEIKMEAFNLLKHRKYPIEKLLLDSDSKARITDCIISYHNTNYNPLFTEYGFSEKWIDTDTRTAMLLVSISNRSNETSYSVEYDYHNKVLSDKEIEALHIKVLKVLGNILNNPNQNLENLIL